MSRVCLGQKEHRHSRDRKNISQGPTCENFWERSASCLARNPLKRLGVTATPQTCISMARYFCLYDDLLLPWDPSILVPLLHALASSIYRDARLALHRTPFQCFQQLRSCCQSLCCLGIADPLSSSLVHLWPLCLLFRNCTLPELIACFRGILRQL